MDDLVSRIDKDMEEIVTGLDFDDVKVKSEEIVGDNEEVYSKEFKLEIMDYLDGRSDKDFKEFNMIGFDYYNGEIEGIKGEEIVEDDDEKNIEDVWNDIVIFVK